jgi:hypothetical protein
MMFWFTAPYYFYFVNQTKLDYIQLNYIRLPAFIKISYIK